MTISERPVQFTCEGEQLFGICTPAPGASRLGVVIVVGGPQYRVGSHRQFVHLARSLAGNGIPAFRFDYRGMGDAEGAIRPFDCIDADIRVAIDAFRLHCPAVEEIVLWGLCDGASAALMYAAQDERVTGLVLLNPWVRDGQTEAVTQIKHYYARRIFNPDLWRKVIRGRFQLRRFLADARRTVSAAMAGGSPAGPVQGATFQERMLSAWQRFQGRALIILSGRDLTAKEFLEYSAARPPWQRLLDGSRTTRQDFPDADHTFSTRQDRDAVAACTARWIHETFVSTDSELAGSPLSTAAGRAA